MIKPLNKFISTNEISLSTLNICYFSGLILVLLINVYLNFDANFALWIEILGTIIQIAIPAYVFVPIIHKKDFTGFKQMLIAFCIIIIVTHILKNVVPAKRPYGGSMSFPSGHTAGAFCGAFFLSIRYGLKYALVAFPLAIYVAFSRLYSHNHWPIDVISSIILCALVSFCFLRKFSANALAQNNQ